MPLHLSDDDPMSVFCENWQQKPKKQPKIKRLKATIHVFYVKSVLIPARISASMIFGQDLMKKNIGFRG